MRPIRPEIDLRRELLQLDLNRGEVDAWLGDEFEEKDEFEPDFRFDHDIPLQRSISLDRGIEIFEYLQTLSVSSDDSDVSTSYSTISSDVFESNLRFEQYRSFEDIPASPMRAKSRHVSLDVTNSVFGNSLALSVLRESYKGIDAESGKMTPQIRKLQKTYSKNFDVYRDSAKSSIEHLERAATEVDMSRLKDRVPMYRSLSYEGKENETNEDDLDGKKLRQRRTGVTTNVWQENPIRNLRKEVLIRQNLTQFKSCEEIFARNKNYSLRGSVEAIDNSVPFADLKESYKRSKYSGQDLSNIRKLKRNVSFRTDKEVSENNNPPSVSTGSYTDNVANDINNRVIDSSNLVEVDRNCNCSICSEVDDHRQSFLSKNLHRIFLRLVSYKDYSRNLVCWDENNNMNENEMYGCVLHVLKMLLGLWLRHFDHNQPNICC